MYFSRLVSLNLIRLYVLTFSLSFFAYLPSEVRAEDYSASTALDESSARALIKKFRDASPSTAYYLEFTLNQIPRHGDTTRIPGHLWATRNERGNVWRIEINPGKPNERRFLVQNGVDPAVWYWDPKGMAQTAQKIGLMTPLFPGSEASAFDLQMPYLYWSDIKILGLSRMRGRPSYQFLFKAPSDFNSLPTQVSAVRAYLDTQYNAPVQTELISNTGKILKTLTLGDLKKVQGQWIPKTVDIRNENTRNKTQFEVISAALSLDLSPWVFNPGDLNGPTQVPVESEITRF
jgi:hypothetical protein